MDNLLTLLKNEYLQSIIILLLTLTLSKFLLYLLKNYIQKITAKTESDIDDLILDAITWPFYFFFIFLGTYFSVKRLSIITPYTGIINSIFFVIYVLLFAVVLARVLTIAIGKWLKIQKRYEKTPMLISKFVSVLIFVIAFLMILSHFEIEITPIITTLGLGGLAIGLALQNTLTNFFAGIHILSDKPINLGDYITLENSVLGGYVEDIGWRSTRLRTLSNTIIVVPNGKLAESIVTNNSLPIEEMSITVPCGVGYKSDLKKVEKITLDVAQHIQKTVPGALPYFEPTMRFNNFGASNIDFNVTLRIKRPTDSFLVKHEFIKALKERFDKEHIEIAFQTVKIIK